MEKLLSYIVYRPPKSISHGHGVRTKNVRKATQKVISAFLECFDAKTDNKVQLLLSYDKKRELEKAHKTINKLNEYLGLSIREWDNIGYENMENTITWESHNSNIVDILEFVDKINNADYLPFSKYSISSFYHYGNKNEANGYIMCSIEYGRLFVRLGFIIPYPINSEKSFELIYKFNKLLPFKLNGKYFRRAVPSNKGHKLLKLDEDTQKRIYECLTN